MSCRSAAICIRTYSRMHGSASLRRLAPKKKEKRNGKGPNSHDIFNKTALDFFSFFLFLVCSSFAAKVLVWANRLEARKKIILGHKLKAHTDTRGINENLDLHTYPPVSAAVPLISSAVCVIVTKKKRPLKTHVHPPKPHVSFDQQQNMHFSSHISAFSLPPSDRSVEIFAQPHKFSYSRLGNQKSICSSALIDGKSWCVQGDARGRRAHFAQVLVLMETASALAHAASAGPCARNLGSLMKYWWEILEDRPSLIKNSARWLIHATITNHKEFLSSIHAAHLQFFLFFFCSL